jgi:hypothetical protein
MNGRGSGFDIKNVGIELGLDAGRLSVPGNEEPALPLRIRAALASSRSISATKNRTTPPNRIS